MPKEPNYLPEFELYLLMAVARLGRDAYGAAMRREIEERSGRPVSMGAVYATLGRLSDKGLVRSERSEPLPVQGGRSRRLYQLTPAGRRDMRHSLEALWRMAEGLEGGLAGGGLG